MMSDSDILADCHGMEEALIATGSTATTESDVKMECSSDTSDDSEDENSDVEITFGPWPPFPSRQDAEMLGDKIQATNDVQDSSQPSEHCEGEQDFLMESISSDVSLDAHTDLESVENYTKIDDIISQCVQADETEMVDVIGPSVMATSKEACELNFENTIKKTSLDDTELVGHDESRIPTDTEAVTDIHSGNAVESTDITDVNKQTINVNMTSLPTECDDVISKCVPSDGGVSQCAKQSVNSDVIDEHQTSILVKEEPKMDGYPDSCQSEIAKDDNLFVSTEHGKMFMRTVAAAPLADERKEIEASETDSLTDDKLARRGLSRHNSGKFQKLTTKPVHICFTKKAKAPEEEFDTDTHKNNEHMPGRILGQDDSPEQKTIVEKEIKESTEQDEIQLDRRVMRPRTKTGKFKKISQKLVHNSPKKTKALVQRAEKLTRKRRVSSPPKSSSPVFGDDTMPEDKVSYSLRPRQSDKDVGSHTSDNVQVDLSLVKTEPEDYSEQDNTAEGTALQETDSTSWIKKESFTEDKEQFTDNAMETNMPVPVKLIRNEVINSWTPESRPASVMVGGQPITLQSGQKIFRIGGGSDQQKFVKVIKLNNIKNPPNVVPLAGNLKLFRIQKTPTMPSCEGREIPLSSVLNHKNVTLAKNTADSAVEEQEKKNLMLKKIDGIIKKNLELMKKNELPMKKKGYNIKLDLSSDKNQVMCPQWCEQVDKETGKTTMVLMPNVAQEKKDKNTLKTVIYRYDDRSKHAGGKKSRKDIVISSPKKPTTSSSAASMASSNVLPESSPEQVTKTPVRKRPAMCNSFTQTKKDASGTKKMMSGKAVMVRDASIQTVTSPEKAGTVDEGACQETPGSSSAVTSTSPVRQVSTNSEETDLDMDVEDIDFINLESKPPPDPLISPRPHWNWTGRETLSVGVNTGETLEDAMLTTLDHQYAFAPSKEKQRCPAADLRCATERVQQYRKQWMKVAETQKLIRRRKFLKNKEWEYDCKIAMLKQKLKERKETNSDISEVVKNDVPIENTDASVDVATEQTKQEEKKGSANDSSIGEVAEGKGGGKAETADADSSGNAKLAVAELGTRSSSRIKCRKVQALSDADLTSFFLRCETELGDVEEVQGYEGTTYLTDSSDDEWQQMISGLPPLGAVVDVPLSHTNLSNGEDPSQPRMPGVEDVCVLCVPEEWGIDLYLMCAQDTDLQNAGLQGQEIYLTCTGDIDFDSYTTVVWSQRRFQAEDNESSEEDIVLEIQDDHEDFHEYVDEHVFAEIVSFDRDSSSNQLHSCHHHSTESHHSLKVRTMSALSLKPVNGTNVVQGGTDTSLGTSPSLGSPEVKETEKSLTSLKNKNVPFTRPLKVKEKSQSAIQQDVKEMLPTARLHKVEEWSQAARLHKVEEWSQAARQHKVEEWSQAARQHKVEEWSQAARQNKVEELLLAARQQEVKEMLLAERQQEIEEWSQTPMSRPLKVKRRSPTSRPMKVEEQSPTHTTQEVKELCGNYSSTTSLQMMGKTTQSEEVNTMSSLGSGSKVVWAHRATDIAEDVIVEEIDLNNNDCTKLDSPALFPTEYEYTSTDDYLGMEPLDLSIKQPNVSNPATGIDPNRNKEGVLGGQNVSCFPAVWTNPCLKINCGAEMKFDVEERSVKECNIRRNHTLSRPTVDATLPSPVGEIHTDQDTKNVDSAGVYVRYNPRSHLQKQGDNNACANDERDWSRCYPEKVEFDENANHIGLNSNNNKSCLSNTGVCHQMDISNSCKSQERGGILHHTVRPRSRCGDRRHDASSEGHKLHWEGGLGRQNHQSGPLVQLVNTRQQEREDTILHQGNRIQDKYRSEGGWLNTNLTNLSSCKLNNNTSDRKKGESQEMRKMHFANPQYPYISSMDRHTKPAVHERMLMHMMYSPQAVGASNCGGEEDVTQGPGPTGVNVSQEDNDVPLDLSYDKNYTILRGSVYDQPTFETSVRGLQPNYEIVNKMLNVRKFNSSLSTMPGILTNLRLPDNVQEILCQRALPKPGCIACPPQDRAPSLGRTHPRATGGAGAGKTYLPVPDVVPRAFTDISMHTNHQSTSPVLEKLPDCVSDSIGHNKTHARRGSVTKNVSRKRKTKKDYKVLCQILERCDELNEKPLTGNCHLASVKSGTSCTSVHVQPLVQTLPSMPHRHCMLGTLRAQSYPLPPNTSVVSRCQQPSCSDNLLRMKQPGVSDQQTSVSTHKEELFRPYMDHSETLSDRNPAGRTYRTMNTGFQDSNSNTVGLPGNVKFPEGMNNGTVGISDRMSYVEKERLLCNGNLVPAYPQFEDAGNVQQFETRDGADSQPVAPVNWRQYLVRDNETNVLRYQNENPTWLRGNQRPVWEQDYNGNTAAVSQHGILGAEMSRTAQQDRISQTHGKSGLSDSRKEEGGNHGNLGIFCTGRSKKGYTEKPPPDQTNIVEFVDRSLALAQGLTIGQPVNQPTDHRKVECENYCCKCWSRGKCRSCVCSKTGCHNCRNPLCCFKNMGTSCKNGKRQRKNSVKPRGTIEQESGLGCISELNAGFVGKTHRRTSTTKRASIDVAHVRGSVQADAEQRGDTSEQRSKMMNRPEPVLDRKLVQGLRAKSGLVPMTEENIVQESKTNRVSDLMTERNLVQGSRGNCEPDPVMKGNKIEWSLQNSNMEQSPAFTVGRPVESRSNRSHRLIAVGKDLLRVRDEQDKRIHGEENQKRAETFEQHKIDGKCSSQKLSFCMFYPAHACVVTRDKRSTGFTEGTNESHTITTGFTEGTNESHKITTGFTEGTNESHKITTGFTEGTNESHKITTGFTEGTNESHKITTGFTEGTNVNGSDDKTTGFTEGTNKCGKITTGFTEGTNESEGRKKRTKTKKRWGARKRVGSHHFLEEQNLDKNNNVEGNQRKNEKRASNVVKKEDQVPDLPITKIPRLSSDVLEQEASSNLVNDNKNTLKGDSYGDDVDVNNNDLCCPKSAVTLMHPSPQKGLEKMKKRFKRSPHQSNRKKSKNRKETDKTVESVVILKEQYVAENIENNANTGPQAEIKQDGHTLPKKGRPRTKPLQQQRKCIPKVLIKLEDHTEKYEVTQFTSFHKKDRNIEVGLKSFERFTCRLCCGMYQYNTPDRTSMEDHLAQHLSGRLNCADCGQTFSQAIHVQEHRQKTHRTANFTCELCAKQFFTSTTLKRHLCKTHGHKLFNCKQCPERYSSVDEVKSHVYQVHGGEATKCEKCGVISLSSKAAATHAKSKMCIGREESNVPCPHCKRVLSVSQMAHHVKRIHLRVHTYKCDQCPYTTLARTALNNHVMMHQGVHPYRCELCPFSCVKSYQLSSHMRTHTGVKPYRCDQCSYAAAWNVQLKDHMRAHVSPHSILCKECGILFKDDRCLNLHNKKVHKPKQEVKVTKHGKVKDPCTRQGRLKKVKAAKDGSSAKADSLSTGMDSGCSLASGTETCQVTTVDLGPVQQDAGESEPL